VPNEPDSSGGRTAAYAELIAAVLDLRSSMPTRTFDQTITQAVADGRLTAELGRELRWLQRQSLRELVDHAERVLPATIVALEDALGPEQQPQAPLDDSTEPVAPSDVAETVEPVAPPAPPEVSAEPNPPAAPYERVRDAERPPDDAASPTVDLTARRLLVAGLRTIEERPFP
jgi:hypothetical protein